MGRGGKGLSSHLTMMAQRVGFLSRAAMFMLSPSIRSLHACGSEGG